MPLLKFVSFLIFRFSLYEFCVYRARLLFPYRSFILTGNVHVQAELSVKDPQTKHQKILDETAQFPVDLPREVHPSETDLAADELVNVQINDLATELTDPVEALDGNSFLRRFSLKSVMGRIILSSNLVILYCHIAFI